MLSFRSIPGLVAALLLCHGPALAQPRPADPRLEAATRIFEGLSEAERKAIQADLIWTGHLNSAATGNFGPLTFRAVNGFKAGRGQPDGQLSRAERQELARLARTAREAAGFAVVTDERTGVRIGIPQRLLPKREALPNGGSRWQSADGRITLDVSAGPASEPLAALFERQIAVNPNVPRRITYKLLQPSFFVVAGETPGGRFFRRQASGPSGLRGFSVGYDKAVAASFDKVVTAIADSFEPFPTGSAPAAPSAGTAMANATPVAAATERLGVGLVVARELVLTAGVAVEACKALKVGGHPAKLRLQDQASGLALLDVPGLGEQPGLGLRENAAQPAQAAVVLGFDGNGAARGAVALAAELRGEAVFAPLQPGGAGSPVFDRQGRLAGLVTAGPSDKALVAGVAPQRSYAMADTGALQAILARMQTRIPAAKGDAPEQSTGAIVAAAGKAVVPVSCVP